PAPPPPGTPAAAPRPPAGRSAGPDAPTPPRPARPAPARSLAPARSSFSSVLSPPTRRDHAWRCRGTTPPDGRGNARPRRTVDRGMTQDTAQHALLALLAESNSGVLVTL